MMEASKKKRNEKEHQSYQTDTSNENSQLSGRWPGLPAHRVLSCSVFGFEPWLNGVALRNCF